MKYANLFGEVKASVTGVDRAGVHNASAGLTLSAEQLQALTSPFDQSALIYAGAGAGKTRLLIERVAALLKAGANPSTLAVVTFTRKAAEEIKSRLRARFGPSATLPVCGTVHSLALAQLRGQAETLNLVEDEQLLELVEALREEGLPEDYAELTNAELVMIINRIRETESVFGVEAYVAARFETLLDDLELLDFTGLLKSALSLAKPFLEYVLVDEAQDLSSLQYSFLKKVGKPSAKYWFIGDGDQSIYAFRGSQCAMMDELALDVPQTFVLSANYRSAYQVVSHALQLIRHNPNRKAISWKAMREDAGSVSVTTFDTCEQELVAATNWLQSAPPGVSRVVLSRTQSLITSLRERDLPAYSVHESKGLEWNEVWVMGCESGLFPHPLGDEDEERRLFYVAMTRARDTLRLSRSVQRQRTSGQRSVRKPSRFLMEANLSN